MESEIIKTDDPNVVIERTIIEKEINISNLKDEKIALEIQIQELRSKIETLESYINLPISVIQLVNDEIGILGGNIYSLNERINQINLLLL